MFSKTGCVFFTIVTIFKFLLDFKQSFVREREVVILLRLLQLFQRSFKFSLLTKSNQMIKKGKPVKEKNQGPVNYISLSTS